MSYHLPREIIEEILYKLPIKSLIRCMCVCKFWQFFIKNTTFISTHLDQTKSSAKDDPLLLFRHCYEKKEDYFLYYDNEEFDEYKQLHFPFKSAKSYFFVVGSCNGLICLADDENAYTNTFMLWNPSIQKSVSLPAPNVTSETHGKFEAFVGFGFDAQTNDYKILRIVKFIDDDTYFDDKEPVLEVELYSLAAGSWKSLNSIAPKYEIVERGWQAFVNGIIHFITFRKGSHGGFSGFYILGFHIGDEQFSENMLPNNFVEAIMSIWVYKESTIAIVTEDLYGVAEFYDPYRSYIWIMKQYGVVDSWTKLFTVGKHEGVRRILRLKTNGDVLLEFDGGEVHSCDLETQQIKKCRVTEQPFLYFIDYHVESLVLLDKADDLQ